MQLSDIEVGMTVLYVPPHAKGFQEHPACEEGRVTSVRKDIVFVCFTGETSMACYPRDLRRVELDRSWHTLEELHDRQAADFQALLATEQPKPARVAQEEEP